MNKKEKEFLEMNENTTVSETKEEKNLPDKEFIIEEKKEILEPVEEEVTPTSEEIIPDSIPEVEQASKDANKEILQYNSSESKNDSIVENQDIITKLPEPEANEVQPNTTSTNQESWMTNNNLEENFLTQEANIGNNESMNINNADNYAISNKKHRGVGARFFTYAMGIFLFIIVGSIFLYKTISYNRNKTITYQDNSNGIYQVCLKENNYYKDACLEENMEYISSLISKIPIQFQYAMNYSEKIPYEYNYYVVGKLSIFDSENSDRVLYKSEEVLVDKVKLSGTEQNFSFITNVDIDFPKYNEYVIEYKNRYNLNSDANLEIALYLEQDDNPKKIAKMIIPLSESTINIQKEVTSHQNEELTIQEDLWNKTNITYMIVSVVSYLLALYLLLKMVRFMASTTGKQSAYDAKLKQILREYDRVIVGSYGNYELPKDKRLIKVNNFDELLDARDTLEKPIVYVKVNNVKSEFYVEDIDKVYRYVLKEADFEGK